MVYLIFIQLYTCILSFKCTRLNDSVLEIPSELIEPINIPPVGKFFVAIAPYTGLSSAELSFDKYTVIRFDEKANEDFYKGAILLDTGKAVGNGVFPASHVVSLPNVIKNGLTNFGYAEVIADLKAQLQGEVNLSKGEHVKIVEIKEDWCTVEKSDGSTGTCPIKFLKRHDSKSNTFSNPYVQPSYDNPPMKYDQPAYEQPPPNSFYAHLPVPTDDDQPYCRALYEFKGEHDGELTFNTGDLIYLKRAVNDEWFEGTCQKNSTTGIFPLSFVEVMVDMKTVASNQQTLGVASVLFDFESRFPDELSVSAGDSVDVIDFFGTDWARCRNPITEKIGIIPITFLQIFFDDDEDEPSYGGTSSEQSFSINNDQIEISSNRNSKEIPWDVGFTTFNETTQVKETPLLESAPSNFDCSFFEDTRSMPLSNPPSRPPPPKLTEKKIPPARPIIGPTQKKTQERQEDQCTQVKVCNDSDWASLKAKVVEDLLATETNYLIDLTCWENCIMLSNALDNSQKTILTKGYSMLKTLSQSLIQSIATQQELVYEQQGYGAMFMQMKDQFFKTFATHFRCVEPMSQMIEQSRNTKLQNALQECLQEMRALGSNVFDVPTAIARPTQRCLKYPLYIGEMINNTPLNHRDHPKLMEALKQMTQLASKMNEFKRKKELTRKYQENRPQSLFTKLSKLNMHTFIKKSNRLKYRISSTVGFVTVKDEEFDYLIARLDDAERRVCRFLYAMQIYKKKIQLGVKRYLDTYAVDPKKMCANVIADETTVWEFNNYLKKINHFSKDYFEELDKRVINVGKGLLRCEYTKLIHKRCDKLADYETVKQANKNVEEIQMRRCEYEALNSQVKNVLPKVSEALGAKINELINVVHVLDAEFFRRLDEWYVSERPQNLRIFPLIDFRQFIDPKSQRFFAIDKTLLADTYTSLHTTIDLKRASTIIQDRQSPKTVQHLRPQNEKERDALVKIMKAQHRNGDLRRVKGDYESKDGAFMVKAGDVVAINRQEGVFCLCENGVTSGIITFELLAPFVENHFSTPDTSPIKNQATIMFPQLKAVHSASHIQSNVKKQETFHKQKSVDLIDLQDDLLDLFSSTHTGLQPTNLYPQSNPSPLPLIDYLSEPSPARDANRPLSLVADTKIAPPSFSPLNPFATTSLQLPLLPAPAQLSTTPTSSDPFEDLFRSAINMPLTKVTPNPTLRNSPTPIIPDRPMNKTITLPTPQSLSPIPYIPPPPKVPPPNIPMPTVISNSPKQTLPLPNTDTFSNSDIFTSNGKYNHITVNTPDARRFYEEPPGEIKLPSMYEEPPIEEVTNLRSLYEEPPIETKFPIRMAPLRPSTHASQMTYDLPPTKTVSDYLYEFYIAEYDYSPDADDPNQIVVKEGDRVKILKKQDDSGNMEWWLVEDLGGHSGYVPSAFLRSQFN